MKFSDRVQAWLGIRKGEYLVAISLSAYLFLIVSSYVVTKNVRDALFLVEFGAVNLPYVSIAIAVLVGIFGSGYIRRSRELPHDRLVTYTLLFFASNLVVFWWLSQFEYKWLYPIIYVWAGVFGVIAPMQVWTLANFALTTRQAKRIYAFIGAGGLLGGIAGGFFTSSFADRLGPEDLLLGVVVALLLSVVLVQVVSARSPKELSGTERLEHALSLRESAALIKESKYLLVLAGLVMVSGVVTSLVEYQFKAVAEQTLHSKEELATFFGQFYAYAGIGSLIVQLLLTGPLMRRMGLGFTIMLAPVGLFLGSSGLLIWGTLLSAIVLRTQDQLLKHSIDRTSVELLYVPIASSIKVPVKSFIDSFLSRVADGTAGVLLVLLTSVLTYSARATAVLNLVLIAVWLALAWTARRLYIDELRGAIRYRSVDPRATHLDTVPDARTTVELRKILDSNDRSEVLYALQLYGTFPIGKSLIPDLGRLLDHADEEVRARALDALIQTGDDSLAARVEQMLSDESRRVQAKAIEYLRRYGRSVPLDNVLKFLPQTSNGNTVRASVGRTARSAAILLTRTGRLATRKRPSNVDVPSIDDAQEVVSGLASSDIEQVKNALKKAACAKCPELVPSIATHLGRRDTRGLARKALANCGVAMLPELESIFYDDCVHLRIRMAIPSVMEEVGGDEAWSALERMLDQPDPILSMSVLRTMNRIRSYDTHSSITESHLQKLIEAQMRRHLHLLGIVRVLDDAEERRKKKKTGRASRGLLLAYLEEVLGRSLERIFRLVALRHDANDLRSIYMGLATFDLDVQANSLELFDALLDVGTRRYLSPLLDPEVTVEEKLRFAAQLHVPLARNYREALRKLLKDSDPLIVLSAIDYIYANDYSELFEAAEAAA